MLKFANIRKVFVQTNASEYLCNVFENVTKNETDMLNYELIKAKFEELNIINRRALLIKLFGDTKQSITYFKRVNNPGLEKLEVLADFYDVPIDIFRENCKFNFAPKVKRKTSIREESNVPAVNINIHLDKSVITEALDRKLDEYLSQCFTKPTQETEGEYMTSKMYNDF